MTTRRGVRAAMYIGQRTLLAMTCVVCGEFRQGHEFGWRACKNGSYVDRRCRTKCRWRVMERSYGR